MKEKMNKQFIAYVNIFLLANKIQTTVNAGLGDITAKQWLMLVVLGNFDHAPNLKELSDACGITHQSSKQLLEKLVEKEYVIIEKDKKDKRSFRIISTEKYNEWYNKYNDRNRNFMQALFSQLSNDEIDIFLKVQVILQQNIAHIAKEHFNDFAR